MPMWGTHIFIFAGSSIIVSEGLGILVLGLALQNPKLPFKYYGWCWVYGPKTEALKS